MNGEKQSIKDIISYWGKAGNDDYNRYFNSLWDLWRKRRARKRTLKRAFDVDQLPLATELARNEPYPAQDPTLAQEIPLGMGLGRQRRLRRIDRLRELFPMEALQPGIGPGGGPARRLLRPLRRQICPNSPTYDPTAITIESEDDIDYPTPPGRGLSQRRQLRPLRRQICPWFNSSQRRSLARLYRYKKQAQERPTSVYRVDEYKRLFEEWMYPPIKPQFRILMDGNKSHLRQYVGKGLPMPQSLLDELAEKWERLQKKHNLAPRSFTEEELSRIHRDWRHAWEAISASWPVITPFKSELQEVSVETPGEPDPFEPPIPVPSEYPRYVPPGEIAEESFELYQDLRGTDMSKEEKREWLRMWRDQRRNPFYNPQAVKDVEKSQESLEERKQRLEGIREHTPPSEALQQAREDLKSGKKSMRELLLEKMKGELQPPTLTVQDLWIPENVTGPAREGAMIRTIRQNYPKWLDQLRSHFGVLNFPEDLWATNKGVLAALLAAAARAFGVAPAEVQSALATALAASGVKKGSELLMSNAEDIRGLITDRFKLPYDTVEDEGLEFNLPLDTIGKPKPKGKSKGRRK